MLAMQKTSDLLFQSRLVAIVRLERLDRAPELITTLLDAGVRCVELTLTNPEAPHWIDRLRSTERRFATGEAALGLGSVRNVKEAQQAIDCGAQFVVTPILSLPVIEACGQRSMPIASGAYTPTEIATAWDAGATLVKVFPVRSLGSTFVRDVLAPMPYLKLMPTGGVDANNAREYLQAGAACVGVGGSLCRADWVEDGKWESLRNAAELIVRAVSDGSNEIDRMRS